MHGLSSGMEPRAVLSGWGLSPSTPRKAKSEKGWIRDGGKCSEGSEGSGFL